MKLEHKAMPVVTFPCGAHLRKAINLTQNLANTLNTPLILDFDGDLHVIKPTKGSI
jgi:hypothetical protein